MSDKRHGLGLTLTVAAGCLALLLLVIALIDRAGAGDTSPAIGFPLIMLGLIVLATVAALGWRAASKQKSSSGSR